MNVNKYAVKCGKSLRFWENKGWINEIDPYSWFQWYFRYWLGRRLIDDEVGLGLNYKLVKMIRDAGSKFDDYSISPKIRQILLHWGYESTEKDFFNELSNCRIKMSYYWFNRQEILQKTKEKYSKEKGDEYYGQNKEAIKEKSKERYKNLSQEEKDKIKEYQRKKYHELVQYKKEALKNK